MVWLRSYLTLTLTSWYSKYSIKRIVRFNAGKCLNFIIFGLQILTTLKGWLLRPNFDTMIKENKSTYNRNNVCNFTEKINTSALITVFNHSKSHTKFSCCGTSVFASFFFVWFVFFFKTYCAKEFGDTNGIFIEVENTPQWQIPVFPFCFVHLVYVLRLTYSDCRCRIFKLFLLYI